MTNRMLTATPTRTNKQRATPRERPTKRDVYLRAAELVDGADDCGSCIAIYATTERGGRLLSECEEIVAYQELFRPPTEVRYWSAYWGQYWTDTFDAGEIRSCRVLALLLMHWMSQ